MESGFIFQGNDMLQAMFSLILECYGMQKSALTNIIEIMDLTSDQKDKLLLAISKGAEPAKDEVLSQLYALYGRTPDV